MWLIQPWGREKHRLEPRLVLHPAAQQPHSKLWRSQILSKATIFEALFLVMAPDSRPIVAPSWRCLSSVNWGSARR